MRCFRAITLAVLFLAAGVVLSTATADTKEPASVIAVQVYGSVSVAHGKSADPVPVKDNDALAAGDIVETAGQSGVVLVLPNGSTVTLQERSRLAITLVLQTPYAAPDLVVYDSTKIEPSTSSTSLELMFGTLVAQVRKLMNGSDLSIKTPVGQAGIKGTEFELTYDEDPAGEASYRLSTASGLVLFSPVEGPPVETAANRQVEVRARVSKAGVKLHPVQTRALPAEARARIQRQNQTAGKDVNRTLERMKTLRNARRLPEARPTNPSAPTTKPAERPPQARPGDGPARNTPPVPPKKKPPDSPAKRPVPSGG